MEKKQEEKEQENKKQDDKEQEDKEPDYKEQEDNKTSELSPGYICATSIDGRGQDDSFILTPPDFLKAIFIQQSKYPAKKNCAKKCPGKAIKHRKSVSKSKVVVSISKSGFYPFEQQLTFSRDLPKTDGGSESPSHSFLPNIRQ